MAITATLATACEAAVHSRECGGCARYEDGTNRSRSRDAHVRTVGA